MAVISSGSFRLTSCNTPGPDFVPATDFDNFCNAQPAGNSGLCVVVNAASARGKTSSENSLYVKSEVTVPGLLVYTGHREAPGTMTPFSTRSSTP